MGEDLTLTKSDYKLFLDAPLHLWAKKHNQIQKIPTEFDVYLMNQGYEVEGYAREFIEKFVLNHEEVEIVRFQQAFSDKQFIARTDALVYKPRSDSYDLYEIKSSTTTKPEFIIDSAYQYLIISNQIKINRVFVLHLNKDYTRLGDLNLEQLFIAEDVTQKVFDSLVTIDINREEALEIVARENSKGIQHCYKPGDCLCPGLCHPNLPENTIYNIPRITEKKKIQLLEQGIVDIKDVPDNFPLNDNQRKIVNAAKSNKEYIDRGAIRRECEQFEYPFYFLDYETFLSAIPLFDGYHPQQQMVFQYSLHKLDSAQSEPAHFEHLALTKGDPSISLIKQLRADMGNSGTVFVWNKTFEIGRNIELADIHPDDADFFAALNNRIYDLGDFINHGMYFHPGFKGSWSIKNVLPVMVPELSYSEMEIGKGDQAMMAWWRLINDELSNNDSEKTKIALLAYCKLDTWAMVEIFRRFLVILDF